MIYVKSLVRLVVSQGKLVLSPCSPRDSQESSIISQFKSIYSLVFNLIYGPTLTSIRDYWKNHRFDRWTFVGRVMSLRFNTLSRFVIAFLPRSKHILIAWLQSPSAVILEPKKSLTVSTVSPSICHKMNGPDAKIFIL